MREFAGLAAHAASMAATLAAVQPRTHKVYGAQNINRAITQAMKHCHVKGCSIAQVNLNTGQPHEFKREIARRQRQAARLAAKSA